MSARATNYLLSQVEALGYFERRAPEGSVGRQVFLTPHGQEVGEAIHACLRAQQAEWAREAGVERFAVFTDVLRRLASDAEAPRRSTGTG